MKEWILAMFVISMSLIIKDMAKFIAGTRKANAEEAATLVDHPQKEKVQKYASSFYRLSEIYLGMPYRREYLSKKQVVGIIEETGRDICQFCYQRKLCWSGQEETDKRAELLIRVLEKEDGQEDQKEIKTEWMANCARGLQYIETAKKYIYREEQYRMIDNRMIEGRLAVAHQMHEIGNMMEMVAENMYDILPANQKLQEDIRKKLRKKQVIVKNVWIMEPSGGRRKQVYINMKTKGGHCVAISEIAKSLSEVCCDMMIPSGDGRCTINSRYHTLQFLEDTAYKVLYGTSKLTKEEEEISGDNFLCRELENGRYVICLSDGMGSGKDAEKESELVVELMEQFMDSGFTEETAARMINSALLIQRQNDSFSTIDLCSIDLYSGVSHFLKAGASTTFIKRDHWVETIASTSMAAGMIEKLEFDTTIRKLYHSDILIFVTDGVLDALPSDRAEDTMKDIILTVEEENPAKASREILEKVLGYCDYHARDDMIVLVAGFWKK